MADVYSEMVVKDFLATAKLFDIDVSRGEDSTLANLRVLTEIMDRIMKLENNA